MQKLNHIGTGLVSLGLATAANAATNLGTFNVQMTIAKSCVISATPINFGNLPTITSAETANSTVIITCNAGTPYNLSFTSVAGGLTKITNLANGANNIPVNFSLGAAAAASGTGSGSAIISAGFTETPYLASGLYQAT